MDRTDVQVGAREGLGNISQWPSGQVTESLQRCAETEGRPAGVMGLCGGERMR